MSKEIMNLSWQKIKTTMNSQSKIKLDIPCNYLFIAYYNYIH